MRARPRHRLRPPGRGGRRTILRAAIALAILLASTVHAEELRLGIDGNYTYNSNFFSSVSNEDPASSFQIGPSLQLDDPDGRFRYELGFDGAYQVYADQSGVDAWESRLRARATYDLTARTSVRVTERFRDISNLRFSRQDIALADTALDPNQDRYFRNDLELELLHDLTELLELRLRGEHHWVDFEQNIDRSDSQAFDVAAELRYRVATRHFLGTGLSYTYQDFEQALSRLGSKGEYVTGYATWTWNVTDAITFSANGGPSWIRSDEDDPGEVAQTEFVGGRLQGDLFRANINSCDVVVPIGRLASNCDFVSFPPIAAADLGELQGFALTGGPRVGTDSTLTFFGGASITIDLADWNLDASYARRQSTTSGDGLASSLDRVAFEVEYAPRRFRWSVFVAGSWDRRETLTDATVVDFVVVDGGSAQARRLSAITSIRTRSSRRDNFTLITGYRHRLDQNVAATLDGRYRRTELRDAGPSRPGIDTFFVVLTLEYDFDPISF